MRQKVELADWVALSHSDYSISTESASFHGTLIS